MLYPWKKIKSHFWQKGNTVYGFKTTTKLKLVERSEGLRVLTLLAIVASPRTGGVQGCRLAAAADPEITPEHQSCRHLASTNPPATSTVTMDLLWSSFRRRRGWVNKISTPKPHKGVGGNLCIHRWLWYENIFCWRNLVLFCLPPPGARGTGHFLWWT